ncbi:MAG: LacI family DNA-binding transcriptional regulator [Pseudomonas sp.]|uniref:LacI family DNA-binding transcriptional regulator n=1 Tax=Pseudomonas abieticivorans TaxID=2931382 RepID=UPI0020BF1C51|nr:LacI family DNA-binding transcriptional regulator [Pseudomonas sp. PIA16]MDE1168626.1 LacI family DNA-binding transcriptional regulator [Pseudomonas sp.]
MASSNRPVTLKSMAATLSVDISTVSRVLNGDAKMASKAASAEVVQRIRQLAEELDYRPNAQAASLKTRRSKELGVLMPKLSDLVMATIYEGIDEAADEAGYVTFVSNTVDNPSRQQERAERALRHQVAGLLISDSHVGSEQPLLDKLAGKNIPYVLVCRTHPEHLSVGCDDVLGGRLVAQHLFESGHRHVAVLAGERHASTGVDRTRGFVEFYREQGCEIAPELILPGAFDTLAGRDAGEHLLRSHQAQGRALPTAIFAVNDFLAIGLMGALRDHGLEVGRDIAVVGYNDTPLAAQLPIALSSIAVPMRQMGREAVHMLMARLAGKPVQSILYKPVLHVRASSAKRIG